ncbi:hypothetical protein SDC9_75569 [bioreactor metagenome]|uniref:Uncharacterized protein n=1 Tax=bioreactor metagenome TaxID=1076179 RepID=A0A644YMC3_9ZZZZ
MAMTSFPERDRDVYNMFEDLKQSVSNTRLITTQVAAKIAEKYKMFKPLTYQSIMRIYKQQEALVKIEKLEEQAANNNN